MLQPDLVLGHRFVPVSELVEDAVAWVEEEGVLLSSSPLLQPLVEAQIPQPPFSWASCLSQVVLKLQEEAWLVKARSPYAS